VEHRGNFVAKLNCIGRDELLRTFYLYQFSMFSAQPELVFRVYESPDASDSQSFEFTLVEEEDGSLKITMMHHHDDPRYAAKGIPDSAIPEIARITDKLIRSSSNTRPSTGSERRSEHATKVWQRLEERGMARYDNERDVYYLN
jgi:hypothetical protein